VLNDLLARNRDWSAKRHAEEPEYFTRLAAQQAPEFFWIGCSDSRVPANVVAGLDPGEVFVDDPEERREDPRLIANDRRRLEADGELEGDDAAALLVSGLVHDAEGAGADPVTRIVLVHTVGRHDPQLRHGAQHRAHPGRTTRGRRKQLAQLRAGAVGPQHLGRGMAPRHAGHFQLLGGGDDCLIHHRGNQEAGAGRHRLPCLVLVHDRSGTHNQSLALREFPHQVEGAGNTQREFDDGEAAAHRGLHGLRRLVLVMGAQDGAGFLAAEAFDECVGCHRADSWSVA